MTVPNERADRKRTASLSSVRIEDFRTMEPESKFTAPRPAPVVPALPDFLSPAYRLPTAHTPSLKHKSSDRSIARSIGNFFTRKRTSSSSHGSDIASVCSEDPRTSTATESSRSRAMSPDSLRRFLSDDVPVASEPDTTDRLALSIPDDIAEEDDDDFVVVSAGSEFGSKTILSPPPPISPLRWPSTHAPRRNLPDNSSAVTLKAVQLEHPHYPLPSSTFYRRSSSQESADLETPTSRFSFSSDEGSHFGDNNDDDDDDDDGGDSASPATDNEIPSFYHSDAEYDDDTDCLSPPLNPKRAGLAMGREDLEQSLAEAFARYRLPRTSADEGRAAKLAPSAAAAAAARDGGEGEEGPVSVVNSPPLLAMPLFMDGDFASELKSAGLSF